jgi:hypothetical protein
VPGFVNYKKGCTQLAAASDKVYQLLAHGRWFSPGTNVYTTIKDYLLWHNDFYLLITITPDQEI